MSCITSTTVPSDLDLAAVRASISVLVVAIIALIVPEVDSITTDLSAGIRASRSSAGAGPANLDLAFIVAAVTIDVVAIVASIVAQVNAVSANFFAGVGADWRATAAGPTDLNLASR